jgi:ABC-type multidrug transport system fused ATPase/permease subunit
LLALFRIIEPAHGTISIDGVDITKIGLHDRLSNFQSSLFIYIDWRLFAVRSAISIVPQSPDLFEGTLRENIDPIGEHPDVDIWVALSQVSR